MKKYFFLLVAIASANTVLGQVEEAFSSMAKARSCLGRPTASPANNLQGRTDLENTLTAARVRKGWRMRKTVCGVHRQTVRSMQIKRRRRPWRLSTVFTN